MTAGQPYTCTAQSDRVRSAIELYLVCEDDEKALYTAEERFEISRRKCRPEDNNTNCYQCQETMPVDFFSPKYSLFKCRVQKTKTGGPYWKEFSFQVALLISKLSISIEDALKL